MCFKVNELRAVRMWQNRCPTMWNKIKNKQKQNIISDVNTCKKLLSSTHSSRWENTITCKQYYPKSKMSTTKQNRGLIFAPLLLNYTKTETNFQQNNWIFLPHFHQLYYMFVKRKKMHGGCFPLLRNCQTPCLTLPSPLIVRFCLRLPLSARKKRRKDVTFNSKNATILRRKLFCC